MVEDKQNNKQGVIAKIIAPIVIVIFIAGIWFYKNMPDKPDEVTDSSSVVSEDETGSGNSEEVLDTASMAAYFPLEVTDLLDLEALTSHGLPILIDFGADSCIPCKEMAPVLTKLNEELAGKAIVLFVDVWKYQDLMEGYPVEVIPTQIFIDANGNPYIPSENTQSQFIQYSLKDTGEHVFTAHQGGMNEEQILVALEEMGMER